MLLTRRVAFCFFAFPDLRSSWRLFVLFLSCCDFLQGVFYSVYGARTFHYEQQASPVCIGFALMGIWSASSSFLWTACVSVFVAGFLVRHMQSASTSPRGSGKRQTAPPIICALFIGICFTYPTLMVVLLLVNRIPINHNREFDDAYGCFIDGNYFGWRFASVYAPLWCSMVVVVISSAFTLCQLTSLLRVCDGSKQQLNLRRLRRKVRPSAPRPPSSSNVAAAASPPLASLMA